MRSQTSPGFPPSPSPHLRGNLGGSYFLSKLPTTPTPSLSQTISCSFPSDQFLRKLIIHRGRRQKSLRAKNTEKTWSPFSTLPDNLVPSTEPPCSGPPRHLQFLTHSRSQSSTLILSPLRISSNPSPSLVTSTPYVAGSITETHLPPGPIVPCPCITATTLQVCCMSRAMVGAQ